MKIKITCDSTCDLTKELIEKYDFSIIPVGITLEEKIYKDGMELSSTELQQAS